MYECVCVRDRNCDCQTCSTLFPFILFCTRTSVQNLTFILCHVLIKVQHMYRMAGSSARVLVSQIVVMVSYFHEMFHRGVSLSRTAPPPDKINLCKVFIIIWRFSKSWLDPATSRVREWIFRVCFRGLNVSVTVNWPSSLITIIIIICGLSRRQTSQQRQKLLSNRTRKIKSESVQSEKSLKFKL